MRRPVFVELAPVRLRQRWLFALRVACWGLVASSLAALALALGRSFGATISLAAIWGTLLAGPVLGALLGAAWRHTFRSAALAIDAHYHLKDRVLTALAFVTKPGGTPWAELQVADALTHLQNVDSRRVVPLRAPRVWPVALGGVLLVVAATLWPIGGPQVEAGPAEPLAVVVGEAEKIAEDLKAFEEIAKQERNDELDKLIEELREKVEEMKQPGVDVREALAKLSEMQEAMQTLAAQYNVAAVDAQLQSLGNALQNAQSLESAGQALAESKYDKAADELEKLDEFQLEKKEAKVLEEKLKKLAEEMADSGFGALAEAASQIAEGTKNGGKMRSGTRSLAKEARGQAQKKKISDLLARANDKLSESKCNCQSNNLAKFKKLVKSNGPSSTFGMSTSGNGPGDPTNPDATLQFEQITGQEGDGDSEVETTHSLEGKQQAARGYSDAYQKYRKLSESVLDSEPIPLGHRQTIRRYFEMIRPNQTDEAAAPSAEK